MFFQISSTSAVVAAFLLATNANSVKAHGNHIHLSNETVHWGYFSKTIDPILTVDSGEKVVVEVRGTKKKSYSSKSVFLIS